MAAAVFQHLVDQAELSAQIEVDSAGIGNWHVGQPPHYGTRKVLQRQGIMYSGRARQITLADLHTADYLVAMDADNADALRRLDRSEALERKLFLLLDFAPQGTSRDVPDPYFENNFDEVHQLIEAGCQGLLEHIRTKHKL